MSKGLLVPFVLIEPYFNTFIYLGTNVFSFSSSIAFETNALSNYSKILSEILVMTNLHTKSLKHIWGLHLFEDNLLITVPPLLLCHSGVISLPS